MARSTGRVSGGLRSNGSPPAAQSNPRGNVVRGADPRPVQQDIVSPVPPNWPATIALLSATACARSRRATRETSIAKALRHPHRSGGSDSLLRPISPLWGVVQKVLESPHVLLVPKPRRRRVLNVPKAMSSGVDNRCSSRRRPKNSTSSGLKVASTVLNGCCASTHRRKRRRLSRAVHRALHKVVEGDLLPSVRSVGTADPASVVGKHVRDDSEESVAFSCAHVLTVCEVNVAFSSSELS